MLLAVSCAASVITTPLIPSPVINPLILYPNSEIIIKPANIYTPIFTVLNIVFIVTLSISLELLSLIFENITFFSFKPSLNALATNNIIDIFNIFSIIRSACELNVTISFTMLNAIYIPINVNIVFSGK